MSFFETPNHERHGSPSRIVVTVVPHPSQYIGWISSNTHIIVHKIFQKILKNYLKLKIS